MVVNEQRTSVESLEGESSPDSYFRVLGLTPLRRGTLEDAEEEWKPCRRLIARTPPASPILGILDPIFGKR